MLETLVKGQPDWHLAINRNTGVLDDKLSLLANITFNTTDNIYIVEIRNIPQDVATNLPQSLPDIFTVTGRAPNDYQVAAYFRVGNVDFEARDADFQAGDVVSINFDRVSNTCFFRRGGGGTSSLAAYAGSAYAGFSYAG